MGMMNLKAMMKQPVMKSTALEQDGDSKPGLLKKKPFGGIPKMPNPTKGGGLAAKLTGKW